MLNWPQQQSVPQPAPRTIRPCRTCGKPTPHEVRSGSGVIATVCVPCLQKALNYELDRD
jgi:hypothetical protein